MLIQCSEANTVKLLETMKQPKLGVSQKQVTVTQRDYNQLICNILELLNDANSGST